MVSCLNSIHNGNAISLTQILKNSLFLPVATLSRRYTRVKDESQAIRKRIALILLMISAGAGAQAQNPQRNSSFPASQSTADIDPFYVQMATPPEHSLRYDANDLGLMRSPIKVAPYEPGLKTRASRMKIAGITMVTVGAAFQIAGIVELVDGFNKVNPDNSEGEMKMALGIVMFAGGTGVAVPGVFVWIKGARKYKRAMAASGQSVRLNLSAMPSLTYRF